MMIRLIRWKDGQRVLYTGLPSEVWALDTPTSRTALEKLKALGDAQYGAGSHEIEESDIFASNNQLRGQL